MNNKRLLIWATIVLVVIVLNLPLPASMRIESGAREGLAPFQNVMSFVLHKGGKVFAIFTNAKGAIKERDDMLLEIARLREQVRDLEPLAEENARLRKSLRFTKRVKHRLIPCEVIGRGDISGWWQKIRLNKGNSDGISPDLAVITADGLVGKTTSASRNTCDVLLITDPNCKVAAKIPGGGGFGVVRGQGVTPGSDTSVEMLYSLNPCRMDYIEKTEAIRQGDKITTSGLGGTYPAGLLIGSVLTVKQHSTGLYNCAEVVPAAKLMDLNFVFVVVKEERADK